MLDVNVGAVIIKPSTFPSEFFISAVRNVTQSAFEDTLFDWIPYTAAVADLSPARLLKVVSR